MLGWGECQMEHRHVQQINRDHATMGIDIGKNSFHVVGLDRRGAIVLRQKWLRGQIEARLGNMPPCLIGMEACVGAHHLSRKLHAYGHDARLMPAKYVRAYSKGQKNGGGPSMAGEDHDLIDRIAQMLRDAGVECEILNLVPTDEAVLRRDRVVI